MLKKTKIIQRFILLIIICFIYACNPLEELTDAYGDVVDSVVSDDNDDDDEVGKVIATLTFPDLNQATSSVTVLTKSGKLVKDDTKVECLFTNPSDGSVFFRDFEATVSGVVTCGTSENTGTVPFSLNFTATSEGVSSETQFFFLGVSATT